MKKNKKLGAFFHSMECTEPDENGQFPNEIIIGLEARKVNHAKPNIVRELNVRVAEGRGELGFMDSITLRRSFAEMGLGIRQAAELTGSIVKLYNRNTRAAEEDASVIVACILSENRTALPRIANEI